MFNGDFNKFAVKFGSVEEDVKFYSGSANLISLEGCPQKIGGDFNTGKLRDGISLEQGPKIVNGEYNITDNTTIMTWDFIPKILGTLSIHNTGISSLIGISEYFTKLGQIDVGVTQIKEGGLGLLLIENFRKIYSWCETPTPG